MFPVRFLVTPLFKKENNVNPWVSKKFGDFSFPRIGRQVGLERIKAHGNTGLWQIGLDNAWILANPITNTKSIEVIIEKDTLTPNKIIKIYKKNLGQGGYQFIGISLFSVVSQN